jgi:uncharacterized protein YjbJ (UPF0337 family)
METAQRESQGAVRQLTDDDSDILVGKKEQLSGKSQKRYGYARDEADRHLDEWHRQADF